MKTNLTPSFALRSRSLSTTLPSLLVNFKLNMTNREHPIGLMESNWLIFQGPHKPTTRLNNDTNTTTLYNPIVVGCGAKD